GKVFAREELVRLAPGIREELRRGAGALADVAHRLRDLGLGLVERLDVAEGAARVVALRRPIERRMIVVPAVALDAEHAARACLAPPVVGPVVAAEVVLAIELVSRCRRSDDEAGGTRPCVGERAMAGRGLLEHRCGG